VACWRRVYMSAGNDGANARERGRQAPDPVVH